jgi:hypothetical protein
MKYFLPTRSLYTDKGELIKRLECPKRKRWVDLSQGDETAYRTCDQCDRSVYDTAKLSEGEVLQLLERERGACLRVSAYQENVEVVEFEPARVGSAIPDGKLS